ncbi:hypothetical protein SUGI_0350330 [Cryptomeria japonica]|nr:hypothetical protein SUGI_0350330 [Cryptomeria japonica]
MFLQFLFLFLIVGIEDQVQEVKEWLQKETTDEPLRLAIIHGFGGIGKTILATAVYSKLNLDRYIHTRVVMDTDPHRNDIKKMQEQILEDAFPKYNNGKRIDLRNTKQGKEHLERAFREEKNHVFLFIDNALRNKDLRELLPEDLEGLGKHIRLLLTTRDLAATNMFNKSLSHEHRVKPLQESDAKKILCKETKNLDRIRNDVDRILKICGGVPLVLKIVSAHLKNQGYKADKCREILNAMERGEAITEDLKDLSECMVDFVFKKFGPLTQEAFLDICCFFYGMNRRHVEYSVGSLALKTLEDAALIAFKVVGNTQSVVVDDVILAIGKNMGRSTRIKDIESFKDAVEEKRLGEIKGIQFCFGKGHSSYVFGKAHLDSMRKSLRVFMLGPNISVKSTSDMKFPELRFLHLDEDIPCLPFHLEDLDKLAVYHGPLLKEGVSIYKLPKSLLSVTATAIANAIDNLERTNGEQSKPLQVPPNSPLEELNLVRLWKMKTLPEGFQNFTALKILSLDTWDNMEELPVVICELPRLSTLTLGY